MLHKFLSGLFIKNCIFEFFFFNFQLSDKVSSIMKPSADKKLGLITQVESALSLLNLRAVCEHGTSIDRPFRFEALVFGSDDFLVSIGGLALSHRRNNKNRITPHFANQLSCREMTNRKGNINYEIFNN